MTLDALKKSLGALSSTKDDRMVVEDNVELTLYATLGQLTLSIDKVLSVHFDDSIAHIATRGGEYVVDCADIRGFHSRRRDRSVGYAS